MIRKYAGVGARQTPTHILGQMTNIASALAEANFILRTGGATGADRAFEIGCDVLNGTKEIYIPWKGYNNLLWPVVNTLNEAIKIASQIHPAWDRCTQGAKKLHGRNVNILLGSDLDDPVDFVICWTADGKATGGTGITIRLAEALNIPVFNLYNGMEEFTEYVNKFNSQ